MDDGSTDQSSEILRQISENGNVSVLTLQFNQGKAEAIRQGFLSIKSAPNPVKYVGFLDADGAIDINAIQSFLNSALITMNGKNIKSVWASRVKLAGWNITRSPFRHFVGRVIHTIIGIFFQPLPYDSQCGLKIFETNPEFWDCLVQPFRTRWFFDLEILIRFQKLNSSQMPLLEVPLENWREVSGGHLKFKSIFKVFDEIIKIVYFSRKKAKY